MLGAVFQRQVGENQFVLRIGELLQKQPEDEKLLTDLGKTSIKKKHFLSGLARMMGGGVYPCPNFLALFLEVHFWSIKRVYFLKNANVLNF